MNNTQGKHIILELSNFPPTLLNDKQALDSILEQGIVACGATIKGKLSQSFDPQGVSLLYLLAESHLSIHTWPEYGYASADMYTCGNCDPRIVCDILKQHVVQQYNCEPYIHVTELSRGLAKPSDSKIFYHEAKSRF
jgi:S-adenosylmethionine decarboxylase